MAECIEKSFPTCGDCFHVKACMAMLRSSGYEVVDEWNSDASRCGDFVAAADVSPVVRCKDCKNLCKVESFTWLSGECEITHNKVTADFFCAFGQRKDGDG